MWGKHHPVLLFHLCLLDVPLDTVKPPQARSSSPPLLPFSQCTYGKRSSSIQSTSSIKLHNLFLINVGPVIIIAVSYRLTGCRPGAVETQCFDVSPFCSQSIYTTMVAPVVVTSTWRSTEHSIFALIFFGFDTNKKFAMPN